MSEIANTVRRFPMSLPSGLHTDEVADLIESQAAKIERLQARVDELKAAIRKCVDGDDSYYNVTADLAKTLEGEGNE